MKTALAVLAAFAMLATPAVASGAHHTPYHPAACTDFLDCHPGFALALANMHGIATTFSGGGGGFCGWTADSTFSSGDHVANAPCPAQHHDAGTN